MSKTSKQTSIQKTDTSKTTTAERAVLGLLTGLAMVVCTELILEHHPAVNHHGQNHDQASITELFARAEGRGEAARLPEEFDIGLQTPHVAGL